MTFCTKTVPRQLQNLVEFQRYGSQVKIIGPDLRMLYYCEIRPWAINRCC